MITIYGSSTRSIRLARSFGAFVNVLTGAQLDSP